MMGLMKVFRVWLFQGHSSEAFSDFLEMHGWLDMINRGSKQQHPPGLLLE